MMEELERLIKEVMFTEDSFDFQGVKFTSRCEDGNWYLDTEYMLTYFDYCADGLYRTPEEVAEAIMVIFEWEEE